MSFIAAADSQPWAVIATVLVSIVAAIVGVYKGFIEGGSTRQTAVERANEGAMSTMTAINDRLLAENNRLIVDVKSLRDDLTKALGRIRDLEHEVLKLGGNLPDAI